MIKKEYFTQKDGREVVAIYNSGTPIELACSFLSREDESLLDQYDWNVHAIRENQYVDTLNGVFHRMAYGDSVDKELVLDHMNLCKFDNFRGNLSPKTRIQNLQNVFRRNYINDGKDFRARIKVDPLVMPKEFLSNELIQEVDINRGIIYGVSYTCESDACLAACILENLYKKYNPDFNLFDIVQYRRDDFQNLFLERTGKITKEEADLRHILSYRYNAWYIVRYGLQNIYNEYNIKIPEYKFDEHGYMIDPSSGMRLCPSRCNTRQGIIKFSTGYQNIEVKEQLDYHPFLSILDMNKKHFYIGDPKDLVDEDLLFTEASSIFAEYKSFGYTNRAALKYVEDNYSRYISQDILNKVLDKILDNAINERVGIYKRQEECRIIVSFFRNFCGVSFDINQFTAEFYSYVAQKESIGYHHRVAIITTMQEYLYIFGLDKCSLFIRYYSDEKEAAIYNDLYGITLDMLTFWRGLELRICSRNMYDLVDKITGKGVLFDSINGSMMKMFSNSMLGEPLTGEECLNIKKYEKKLQEMKASIL